MPVPKRLGLVTANQLARKLKTILQKFRDVAFPYLDAGQQAKYDDLISCCDLFITDVPQYPTE